RSRWTDLDGSSSTILSTCTSLLSCLVTCSSGWASTSTTTVMREISGCSVWPTASEWMLNARRENRPATRARTPGWLQTGTDRLGLDIALRLAVPLRRDAARVLDLVVARAGRDHRPHHGVTRHGEVHDHGLVVDLHGPLDGRVHIGIGLTADAHAAHRLRELHEVGHALGAVARVQVGVRVALGVEQRLPLADHAVRRVVDDRHLDAERG